MQPPANGTEPKNGAAAFAIGEWAFFPATNELVRNGERRRLEDRAARTLDFLRQRQGVLVSKEDLIAAVWDGRTLSDHTVAVVISDLRKALDDDAKRPRYIETVSKRGYRLLAPVDAAAATPKPPARAFNAPWMKAGALVAAVFLLAGAAFGLAWRSAEDVTIVTVNNIKNETGEARFDPLAASANEFSASYIAKADRSLLIRDFFNEPSWDPRRYTLQRFGRSARVYHLYGTVVLNGADPYLALSLADGRDWTTVWATTEPIVEGDVAAPLARSLGEMLATIEPARG